MTKEKKELEMDGSVFVGLVTRSKSFLICYFLFHCEEERTSAESGE